MTSIAENTQTQQPNPWTKKITVVDIRPYTAGNLRAFATIKIGDALEIHGCRIVQQPGQKPWVSLPQEARDGKYWPLVKATDDRLKEAISDAVLAAWRDATVLGGMARGGGR